MEIDLAQMLAARDKRAETQRRLLEGYKQTLVSFNMNIPGPVKYSGIIQRAFDYGCRALEHRLPKGSILHRERYPLPTGCEGYYVVKADPQAVKRICMAIEDGCPVGRLFDLDVWTADGMQVSTGERISRGCMVCGAPGRECASRRVHSVTQLQQAVWDILESHFAKTDGEKMASLAVRSLLDEVSATPKPGLVDRNNAGSHGDMDIFTFNASAAALWPYFYKCFEIGRTGREDLPTAVFDRLREAGLQAECDMLEVTGGVNTHKGAIYTLGLLCGACGRLWRPEGLCMDIDRLCTESAGLAAAAVQADLEQLKTHADTAGGQLYRTLGLTGIRGEVSAGLPAVRQYSLPVYREAVQAGVHKNRAAVQALLHLIAHVEDTNLYHRGGPQGAAWAREAARACLEAGEESGLFELDRLFIEKNLSPGGCADLLAVTLFLAGLETNHREEL